MSSTQYLTDAATRHQVFLQRFAGSESKKAQKVLDRLRRGINARLAQEPTDFQRNRLEIVLRDINELSSEAFSTISRQTMFGATELTKAEGAFSVRLFDKATTTETRFIIPTDEVLIANVMQSSMQVTMNTGVTVEDSLRQFGTAKAKQIAQTISDGVILGEATSAISRNVGNLINTLQRRQLDSLVRTITNHSSSAARKEIYSANSDIMDGYRWVATLDNRTTFICGSRDGKIFPDVPGSPLPPAHFNCRSTTIPNIKPEFDVGAKLHGDRPAVGADGVEQVSSRKTYGGWLKTQPTAFVDEALGVERSKLFRSGKLTIDKFVDNTGRVYTLEQLESLNPLVFLE